jgi:FSR family fosmidomycin resistance protein-like MFS transporter
MYKVSVHRQLWYTHWICHLPAKGITMELNLATSQRLAVFRNRPLLTLMLGHFTVDTYVGLLPMLFPLLIERFSLDFKTVGLVALAYSGMASLAQPLFGWLADRYGTRLIGLALIWTSAIFAILGFVPSFPWLVVLAGAAGLGSGMYHPFGALNASAVIDGRQRNTAMSVYVTGGTLGVAIAPLLGIPLFSYFGSAGTAIMLIPGLGIAAWMLVEMRGAMAKRPALKVTGPQEAPAPIPWAPLLAVIGVMMSRTWTVHSLEAFIPTWYKSLGYSASFYGPLATTVVLASAFGTIGVGSLADRFGRKTLIIGSLILTIPILFLFAQFPGPLAFVTGTLVGFSAASTGPLMLVMAQQLMAKRAGVASGLILGLGFITGAIGVPITGALADAFGFSIAIQLQIVLVAATIAIAWFLPGETDLEALAQQN